MTLSLSSPSLPAPSLLPPSAPSLPLPPSSLSLVSLSVQLVADAVLSDPSLDGELAQHVLIRELAPAECGVRKVVLAGVDDAYGGRRTTH